MRSCSYNTDKLHSKGPYDPVDYPLTNLVRPSLFFILRTR